eukprot:Partr_v1_DN28154_c1_g1_i1_m55738 putative Glucoside xylosyltransferase
MRNRSTRWRTKRMLKRRVMAMACLMAVYLLVCSLLLWDGRQVQQAVEEEVGGMRTIGVAVGVHQVLFESFLARAWTPRDSSRGASVCLAGGGIGEEGKCVDLVLGEKLVADGWSLISVDRHFLVVVASPTAGSAVKTLGPGKHRCWLPSGYCPFSNLSLVSKAADSDCRSRVCVESCQCLYEGFSELPHLSATSGELTIADGLIAVLCHDIDCQKSARQDFVFASGSYPYVSLVDVSHLRLLSFEDALLSFHQEHIDIRSILDESHVEHSFHISRIDQSPVGGQATLVTQLSANRLARLGLILQRWSLSPVTAVLFITHPLDLIIALHYITHARWSWFQLELSVIIPPLSRLPVVYYPINALRNYAISRVKTDFMLLIDADFIPSDGLDTYLKRFFLTRLSSSPYPLAFVITSIGLRESYDMPFVPDSFDDISASRRHTYNPDFRAGHGPTMNNVFWHSPMYGDSRSFEVCYESQWEPYYLLERRVDYRKFKATHLNAYQLYLDGLTSSGFVTHWFDAGGNVSASVGDLNYVTGITPLYDPRFANQGGDKQAHALLLNALGYRFEVIRKHFMVHLDHQLSISGWPGGLKGDSKFDNDLSILSYFSDFLPEMERAFGWTFRWPRGCRWPFGVDMKNKSPLEF